MHVPSDALYAVIEGKPIIWWVVRFTDEGEPQMAPVARVVKNEIGDPDYRPEPVRGGALWMPAWTDPVIYAPDCLTLMEVIKPWIETERTDG
jgi:hypothetical protein